jgi:hypothetical protein
MWTVLRTLLRLGTLVLLLAAAYLVVFHPSATVAGVDLGSPTSVSVKCSSLFDQWDHHARPAELEVDGNPTVPLTSADNACASGSTKVKKFAGGAVVAAVAALAVSFLGSGRRRR